MISLFLEAEALKPVFFKKKLGSKMSGVSKQYLFVNEVMKLHPLTDTKLVLSLTKVANKKLQGRLISKR